MLPNYANQTSTPPPASDLLEGILNASLNGIIAYESVRNGAGETIDFRAVIINRVAQQILHLPDTEPGWQLLALFPSVNEHGLFRQYTDVVETGRPLRFETPFQNEHINGWYDIAVVKLGDGFVITFNDITAQRETLHNLTERNGLLDSILESSPSSIASFEAVRNDAGQVQDFRFGMMNEKAVQDITRDFGVSPIDRRLLEVNPDSRQTGQFNLFAGVLETGTPVKHEHFYEKLGLWYQTAIAKIGDGVVVTATDITAEKLAEEQLQQQTDLLRTMLDGSINGVLLLEPVFDEQNQIADFTILATNPAVETLSGVDPEKAVGQTMLTVYPGIKESGYFAMYAETLMTGQRGRMENYYRDEQGLEGWFEVSSVRQEKTVVISFVNTTAFRRAEQQLQQQADFLNTVLGAISNGVVVERAIRDQTGTIVDFELISVNPRAAEITHNTVEGLVGNTELTLHPNIREAGFFDSYVKTIETGEPQTIESHYIDDRLDQWFLVNTRRINTDELVSTFQDVSEVRLAQQQLKQAADDLQAVIDNSQTGIFVFSPVRNDAGEIVDFRFKAINKTVAALIGETPDAIRGDLASDWFISYRDTETFTRYKTTLTTGEEQRFDTNYNVDGLDVWFDVHSVKLGDDVLVTFTDYTDLKQLQLAQEQQTGLLNRVLDSSDNGIASLTAIRNADGIIEDFRFVTVNRVSEKILHVPVETMLGNTVKTLFPGNVESGLFDLYVGVVETGESASKEMHYSLDGLDFWLTVSAYKLGDGFVITFADLTQTRRLARHNEEQANLLGSVLDGSINGIMSFEAVRDDAGTITDFRFLTINESGERIVGVPAETMRQKETLLSVFPGNVASGLFDKYRHTTETGEPTRTEVYYNLDGLDFWLDISAQKLNDGFVVTFTDTSTIKRATQLVQKSAAELQIVIDTTQTGICLFSPVYNDADEVIDFRFRIANRTLAAFAGQDALAAPGTLISTWFPDYFRTGIFDRYKRLYETGGRDSFDFHYDGDGLDVWIDIVATRVDHEILVTFSEFTALKKLQQQLEASVIDLQRSNKNLEQFAYVASHDLQEPLRKIQQFGDILQTSYGAVLDDSGRDMLARMQSAADRMRILIKDVLAYSRITTKRENAKAVDLNKLLRDVIGDLETAISEKNAVVQFDTLPTVMGDAAQLGQLFQNLISNSLKFTSSGRPPQLLLRYTVQRGRDTGLPVSVADETRQFYRLELSDNGIGFDPHQADKIFQVFQRLHNRNEYQGTGIGLAIVQKVVENHQGYIRAEGRPNEGATFTILLPV